MRYWGAILFSIAVVAILVAGRYQSQEVVYASLQLIPTDMAQPQLIEVTLANTNGIHSVQLTGMDDQLEITFDQARLSLRDLGDILAPLGYHVVPVTAGEE